MRMRSPSMDNTLAPYLSTILEVVVLRSVHVPVDCSAAIAFAASAMGRSVVTL